MTTDVLFVHGAWVTPHCWLRFRTFFEGKGFRCFAPPWPFLDRSIEELRAAPDPRLAQVRIADLVDHYAAVINRRPDPPVLIGHSFGGLIVQLLLDRGLGRAGVALDPAPPRGVLPSPIAIRSALPVLLSWRGWKKIHTMSFNGFARTFANGLPADQMRATYEEQIVPAPGRIYFQAALGVGNGLRFSNPRRAPLLLVGGEADRTSTVSMVKTMCRRHSRSPSRTDLLTFPGRSHWLIAEPGWEEVADGLHRWITQRLS